MAKEDYLLKFSMLEQEAGKLQEQLQLINQQVVELENLKLSLDNLDNNKEKEILAPLGKGIYFKSEIKEEDLFVNVGSGIVLRKKPKQAVKIIDDQVKELEKIKIHIASSIEQINAQLQDLFIEAQKEKA